MIIAEVILFHHISSETRNDCSNLAQPCCVQQVLAVTTVLQCMTVPTSDSMFHLVIFSMTKFAWLFFIVLINPLTKSRYGWRLVRYSVLLPVIFPPPRFMTVYLCRGFQSVTHGSQSVPHGSQIVPHGSQSVLHGSQGIPTSFQGIRDYISVMSALKFTYLLKVRKYYFVNNNRVTSLIGDMFISCDR